MSEPIFEINAGALQQMRKLRRTGEGDVILSVNGKDQPPARVDPFDVYADFYPAGGMIVKDAPLDQTLAEQLAEHDTKTFEEVEHPRGGHGKFRRKYGTPAHFMAEHLPEAHIVGGAVRDELLGLTPKDQDFVVPGMGPQQIKDALKGHGRTEDLVVGGKNVGIRFYPSYEGAPPEGVEVVPPRAERSTGPGRHDFEIVADPSVSLAEDAKRRDFTINALYKPVTQPSQRDWPSDGSIHYHVAPREARDSIQQHGIDRTRGEPLTDYASLANTEPGNYTTTSYHTALEDARSYGGDIWAIHGPASLGLEHDYENPDTQFFSRHPIPPSMLELANPPDWTPRYATTDAEVQAYIDKNPWAGEPGIRGDDPFEVIRDASETTKLRQFVQQRLGAEIVGAGETDTGGGFPEHYKLPDGSVVKASFGIQGFGNTPARWIVLTDISAEPQGTGAGTQMMEALKAYADEHNLGINVHKATTDWYKRFPWLTEVRPYNSATAANEFEYRPWANPIIDPLGTGVSDIQNRVLRAASPTSFYEDPLRMVRGLRFISRHDLTPDAQTLQQMHDYAPQIEHVSAERIGGGLDANGMGELSKLLLGDNPGKALTIARDTGLLEQIIPPFKPAIGFQQQSAYHNLTVDNHIIHAIQAAADNGASLDVRLALLFHDLGKPESAWMGEDGRLHYYANPTLGKLAHEDIGANIARSEMRRLRYPIRMQQRVEKIVASHMMRDHDKPTPLKARQFLAKHGEIAHDLVAHKRADLMGRETGPDEHAGHSLTNLDAFEQQLREQASAPTKIGDLAVNGNDLIELGYQAGPGLGLALHDLLRDVIGTPGLNNREWLLRQASQRIGQYVDEPRHGQAKGVNYNGKFVPTTTLPSAFEELEHPRGTHGEFVRKLGAEFHKAFDLALERVKEGGMGRAARKAGDPLLQAIVDGSHRKNKPRVVTASDFDKMAESGEINRFYRGLSKHSYGEDFLHGDGYYVGAGVYGSGTYWTNQPVLANHYAGLHGGGGAVVRMGLTKSARVGDYAQLKQEAREHAEKVMVGLTFDPSKKLTPEQEQQKAAYVTLVDVGRFAAAKGYDAIHVPPSETAGVGDFLVLLNRAATVADGTVYDQGVLHGRNR